MLRTFIGNLGHLFVIISFITALFSAIFYANAQKDAKTESYIPNMWKLAGRYTFFIHFISIIGVIVCLFSIITNHYFEYHYAWGHSSLSLPVYYQISCFWEGQEGSFLLWIFWNAILFLCIALKKNLVWESPLMMFFGFIQSFLVSMILGVVVFDVKIGSSPFILLRDALDIPIFQINPDFIPSDGRGLNPLLQNYWMVIHPPTLFLGFASTVVPFVYALAGLYKKKYTEWVKPAIFWSIFSTLILGVGILMGAYWAYETLNFGGYWNWDPVENAVYIPWLVLVASLHALILFRTHKKALLLAFILVIATFLLILYSTFLTRSGILGDSSVHSFTDLGLSGQLLLYLLFFTLISAVLLGKEWKYIPADKEEKQKYSGDFWMFLGVTVLCFMAFQVFIPTSIPVYNALLESFGIPSKIAPPVNPIQFYTQFQIILTPIMVLLAGTTQFFWYKKNYASKNNILIPPLVLTLLLSSLFIIIARITDASYIFVLIACIYSFVVHIWIILSFAKKINTINAGAVSHIGIACILLGILCSSGYSQMVSLNNTGRIWSKDFPDEINTNNILLFQHQPTAINGYSLIYKGMRKEVKNLPFLVNVYDLEPTDDALLWTTKRTLQKNNQIFYKKMDTVTIQNPHLTYFEIEYIPENLDTFTLYPQVYMDEAKETIIYSPDIQSNWNKDIYSHVRTFPDPKAEAKWSDMEEIEVRMKENFFVNDFVARVETIETIPHPELSNEDIAVKFHIAISGNNQTFVAEPMFLIKDKLIGRIPYEVKDIAAKITILNIYPEKNSFSIGINTAQKEWIILEVVEKPFINIMWLGVFILITGLIISLKKNK